MLKFTGFDQCIIGKACVWHPDGTRVDTLIYDGQLLLAQIHEDMTWEEAMEWIEYNMEGAYSGPDTPIVLWPWDPDGDS